MADQHNERHDGRFGALFDAEISIKAALWSGAAILAACLLGFLITAWIYKIDLGAVDAREISPLPEASVRTAPGGPLLQADPEAELRAMQSEMESELSRYGWIDESQGIAQIPIDIAMDLLIEQDHFATEVEISEDPATAGEPPSEETGH